jgi:hypothetical protein
MTDIRFNSRTKQHSEFSNFAPFTAHLDLDVDRLSIRVSVDDQEVECSSVEAAYQVSKYAMIDVEYVKEVMIPLCNVTKHVDPDAAVKMKKLGTQAMYLPWKLSRCAMTKKALHEWYKEREARFHQVNLDIMENLLLQKFQEEPWRQRLLATGDLPLHEIGRPGFWTLAGDDQLGKLLMRVRDHLRK